MAQIVWYRALASACTLHGLAELLHRDPEEAFLQGLLHDIGNVVVLRTVAEHESIAHASISLEVFEYLCHECHQEFGELVAEAWKLPEPITAIIADHHRYPAPDDPLRTPRLMILLADMINQMLGYAPPAQYDLLRARPAVDLGLDRHDCYVAFLRGLPAQIEETIHDLQ